MDRRGPVAASPTLNQVSLPSIERLVMSGSADAPIEDLTAEAEAAATWSELRDRWQRIGVWDRLDGGARDRLLAAWRQAAADRLSDRNLAADLAHWAEGGDFKGHLAGYNAPDPASLVRAAAARGWFVRQLGAGRWVVNPPTTRPLTIEAPVGKHGR